MSGAIPKKEAQCPVCGPKFVASTRGVRHHFTSIHGGDSSRIIFVRKVPKGPRHSKRIYAKALTAAAEHR